MNKLLMLGIFLLASSFVTLETKGRYQDYMINHFAKIFKQERGLLVGGSGYGGASDAEIVLYLIYPKAVSLEEGRELFLYCTNQILAFINADKQVRPALHNYPVTIKNLDLTISIKPCANRDHIPPGNIVSIMTTKRRIFYCGNSQSGMGLDDLYIETYEEAMQRLKEARGGPCE